MPDELGTGPIAPQDMEYVLRRVRHRMLTLQTVQEAQTGLLRRLSDDTSIIKAEQHTFEGRVFGFVDDPDRGAIGRLQSAQRRAAAQNWAIILLLISVLATLVATLVIHH